jgi:hypothetical protein
VSILLCIDWRSADVAWRPRVLAVLVMGPLRTFDFSVRRTSRRVSGVRVCGIDVFGGGLPRPQGGFGFYPPRGPQSARPVRREPDIADDSARPPRENAIVIDPAEAQPVIFWLPLEKD